MIGEPQNCIGEGLLHLPQRPEPDFIIGGRIHAGAMHQGKRNGRATQYFNRSGDCPHIVHPGTEDNRLAESGNMLDQWEIIALPRTDFIGGDAKSLQSVGGSAGKRRTQIHYPLPTAILQKLPVLLLIQRAARHDFPDRFRGIAGNDIIGNHFIVNDMTLKFDAFAANGDRIVNHLHRLVKISLMIDADFGNDKDRHSFPPCLW